MRKNILILAGLVGCAILVEGVVFLISSRLPAETTGEEPAPPPEELTTFDELLGYADEYRERLHYDVAGGYLRAALEIAETDAERARAGYAMGCMMFEDYERGGDVRPEAAASYLRAAYDDAAAHSEAQTETGMVLLKVYDAMGDAQLSADFLERMISMARDPEDLTNLWRRKFDLLLRGGSWKEMNDALTRAEGMPMQTDEWEAMMADVGLRAKEMLLADTEWLEANARAAGAHPDVYGRRLFETVREQLEGIVRTGEKARHDEALLRLANAYIAMDDYESGQRLLTRFLENEPKEHLTEAFTLLSRISRVLGEVDYAAELAVSLIRRFDFDSHTRGEVLQVVRLLEEHELFDGARDLLRGCFSLTEKPGREYADLIGRAAVLAERSGDRPSAAAYFNQLCELDVESVEGAIFSELIRLAMARSDYEAVEYWVSRFVGRLTRGSAAYGDALFSLFEAKFRLDRPVLDQLFVGSAAVQRMPEDPRAASVELRMARYIEDMKLNDLAVSYYNRIGLLNFFKQDDVAAYSQNVGEQAMLGKARCLRKLEDWIDADHLYREICNRGQSPVVRSEAAVGWAELAIKFGQNREALRRYDEYVYPSMLSAPDLVRYTLGRSRVEGDTLLRDPAAMEETLSLLENLPEEERRATTISFFNDTFDYYRREQDTRAMERVLDLAYQSDYTEWLPIQSYVLQLHGNRFAEEKLPGLGALLREKGELGGAPLMELAGTVERLEDLTVSVGRHKKKESK